MLDARTLGLFCAGALAFATSTHAATVTGDTVASFGAVTPADAFEALNNDEGRAALLRWGERSCGRCSRDQSLLRFDGIGSDGDASWVASDASPVNLLDFGYTSGLNSATAITGQADVSLNLDIDGYGLLELVIGLSIIDTAGANGIDTITLGDIDPVSFAIAGQNFELSVLGFSLDGGASFSDSVAVYQGDRVTGGIYASISEVAPVPLPGAVWLLGSGLIGLVAVARRR